MKLTMKEKKFSIRDSFKIQDGNGNDKYQVVGDILDTGVLHIKDMSGQEWKQLDEQTREEQGLSRVMPDIEAQKMEDYKNPWNDQENSNGFFMPDSYKNPREIRKNEIYYQLRSIEAVYDSPYLTDEKTIELIKNYSADMYPVIYSDCKRFVERLKQSGYLQEVE